MPSVAILMRSSIARSSLVPLPLPPSLNMVCSLASPSRCMFPSKPCDCEFRNGVTPSICPLPITVECRTPTDRARASCSFRNAYSPCTGRKCSGCSIFRISSSSSRYAWPEECKPSSFRIAISGPRTAMAFIIRITRFSFPGIILALYKRRSSGCRVMNLELPNAACASCARGSAWLPVVTIMSSDGFIWSMSSAGTSVFGSMGAMPDLAAASRYVFRLIPTNAIFRPLASAAALTPYNRWMFDANCVVMIRPLCPNTFCIMDSRITLSLIVLPGDKTLVLSLIMSVTPSLPTRSNCSRSKIRPSTGFSSIFQSPVCTIVPAAHLKMNPQQSGMLCVTRTASIANGPALNRSPMSIT
mmetsp:Transcript_5216/g.17436  ORF Transcript_5216/g.17436 Transcript_5216/m.17436 type:complete len:357 (-) Transcript_5216:898-1968(-)